ncbi:MAG: class I SAM-dependent methyltransferase [Acidobacteriota bacterium]|nr:class I SAM-dependent methyltransferase [Acidobacteriota bacterium]
MKDERRMRIAAAYNARLQNLVRKSFPFWQRLGIHIVPNHYYQPIPDTRTLDNSLWQARSELVGIDINEAGQLALLSDFVAAYKSDYENLPGERTPIPHQYYVNNGAFERVDGEILYCMIRHFKPKKIFEIGSGNSTYLSAQTVLKNRADGYECELTAFEPYPNEVLRAGFPGLAELAVVKAQNIPPSRFNELGENDILFIDSSHVLKIGSDVQYEYLEILPRLRQGVMVHIHDIFLPAEYPKEWVVGSRMFWNEQYLLQAFLTFNDSFEVLWAGSYLHLKHPDKLRTAFDTYAGGPPGSFWIRKTR